MNKNITHLCTLLAMVVGTCFLSCEENPIDSYGALGTFMALRNEYYVIEVDSTKPDDMSRFKVPPIPKDSLFSVLRTGGWAETEAYGLYSDGTMTENLLSWEYSIMVVFYEDNSAFFGLRDYGAQRIQYTYDEENNNLTLSNFCLPDYYYKGVRKQQERYSEETDRIISISEEEMLVIGPGGIYDEDFDPPTPYSFRVFTHVLNNDQLKKWKNYDKVSCK